MIFFKLYFENKKNNAANLTIYQLFVLLFRNLSPFIIHYFWFRYRKNWKGRDTNLVFLHAILEDPLRRQVKRYQGAVRPRHSGSGFFIFYYLRHDLHIPEPSRIPRQNLEFATILNINFSLSYC